LDFFANRTTIVGIAGMIAAQMLLTYVPTFNRLFHTAPIDRESWVRIIGVGASAWLIVGAEKWLRFHTSSKTILRSNHSQPRPAQTRAQGL
jgi:magnesium-transporting ATPase (P-type)